MDPVKSEGLTAGGLPPASVASVPPATVAAPPVTAVPFPTTSVAVPAMAPAVPGTEGVQALQIPFSGVLPGQTTGIDLNALQTVPGLQFPFAGLPGGVLGVPSGLNALLTIGASGQGEKRAYPLDTPVTAGRSRPRPPRPPRAALVLAIPHPRGPVFRAPDLPGRPRDAALPTIKWRIPLRVPCRRRR